MTTFYDTPSTIFMSRACPADCDGNSGISKKYTEAFIRSDVYERALRIMAETSIASSRIKHSEAYYQKRINAALDEAKKELV